MARATGDCKPHEGLDQTPFKGRLDRRRSSNTPDDKRVGVAEYSVVAERGNRDPQQHQHSLATRRRKSREKFLIRRTHLNDRNVLEHCLGHKTTPFRESADYRTHLLYTFCVYVE